MTPDRHIPWRNIGALLAVFCVAFAIIIWVPRASHLVLLFIGLALVASGAAPLLHQGALRGWQRQTALLTHVEEKRIEVPSDGFWWRALKAGDKVPGYIEPHDPKHAVLMRNPDAHWHSQPLTLVVAGVLLIGLWLVLQLFSEPLA